MDNAPAQDGSENHPTSESSGSWWTTNFRDRLAAAQHRMRTEQPMKTTSEYLQALEDWEEAENLGISSARTKAPRKRKNKS